MNEFALVSVILLLLLEIELTWSVYNLPTHSLVAKRFGSDTPWQDVGIWEI